MKHPYLQDHSTLTFEKWSGLVDRVLSTGIGLGLGASDMGDYPSRDAYDEGADPIEGAERCLEWQDNVPDGMVEGLNALRKRAEAWKPKADA